MKLRAPGGIPSGARQVSIASETPPDYFTPPMTSEKAIAGASGYIAPLTGIRALAALLVLGFHIQYHLPSNLHLIFPFFDRGHLGVDLFFILSGFIITHVYWKHLTAPNWRTLRIFLWHRFVRIYPVHVTILCGLVILVLSGRAMGVQFNHPEGWQWSGLANEIFLLQVWSFTYSWGFEGPGWNAPSWSISAEWFAYMLFPVMAPAMLRIRTAGQALVVGCGALGALFVVFTVAHWPLNTTIGASALARVLCEFVCGMALCRATALVGIIPRRMGDLVGIAALAFWVVGAAIRLPDFAILPFLALAVWGAATADGPLARLLGGATIIWLGEISYSIYMVHLPVLMLVRRGWEHAGYSDWSELAKLIAVLVTIAFVLLVAAAMFYLVERPVRRRARDRFGKLYAPGA